MAGLKVTERTLHEVTIRARPVRIVVSEKTRRTVKAAYVSYQYYVCVGSRCAPISRNAAVLLGFDK